MKTAGIVPTEAEEGLFPGRTAGQSAKSGSELITSRSQGGISRKRERKPVSGCRIPGALPHYQSGHGRVPEKKSGRQRMNFTDNHSALLLRRTPLPAFRDYAGGGLQKFPGLPAGGSDISHVTPSYVPSSFPGRIAAPLQSNSPLWGGAACLDDHGAQGRSTVFSKINGYPPLQRKPRCSRGTGILRKWRGLPSYYAPDPENTGHSAIFPGLAAVPPEFIPAAV